MVTARKKNWNYFNVLEALLGQSDKGEYIADLSQWCDGLWKLREEYEDSVPELFGQLHFRRTPWATYSEQVSDFFVHQAFGGITKAINPAYDMMIITESAIEELRERNPELTAQYGEVLSEMAKKLMGQLRKPEQKP